MNRPRAARLPNDVARREFLKIAALGAMLSTETRAPMRAGEERGRALVDVNVSLGRWPIRRLPCDDPEKLIAKLRAHGVVQAWTGSLEGLVHKDIGAVNQHLADECRRHGGGLLLPFGSLNPALPDWEEELRRVAEVHRFRGIRLHPNYHGYRLDDPRLARLLELATGRRLIIQITLLMEDQRMMHPLMRVEPVDPKPLAELVRRTAGLRLVLLNALGVLRGEPLRTILTPGGNVWVEIAMLEGAGGLGQLLASVPAERVLFGSHAPLFYFESAELKLEESPLAEERRRAICRENAERLRG